jgi:uncharacterized membrane protein YqiK
MMLIGLGLMVAPAFLELPGAASQMLFVAFGAFVFLIGTAVTIVTNLYRKTSADQAFVRTGMGGPHVIMDGAAIVVPILHQVLDVNLQTMKLAVNPEGRGALITKDNLRSDVLAQFYIKVQPDEEHILMAARSLGENSVNAVTVETLVSEKLVSALRAIASQMDLFEIHTKRDEFAERVKEHVRSDLEENGLLLESVTISALDQTDPSELSDNNVFDAQGKKKITEITAAALVERNRLERDAERERAQKDVETRQQVLELERQKAEAEANQGAEIAKVKAAKDREAQEAEIHRFQAVTTAQVAQEQAIKQAEIARDLSVQTANIDRDKSIELAQRQKQIVIAEQEAVRAKAEETALQAQAERERASQQVVTVTQLAEADREAQKKLIAAKQVIEQNKIAEQTTAEVQAYTRVKQADAEQEAATRQASARLQLAEADAQSRKLVAEGEAAQQMVPVQVERERVNVRSAEVDVEAQGLENRQKFAEAGIELEIQRLRIQADKEIQVAMAEAIGRALSSANMTLYGTPDMAGSMLSNLGKGMGMRTAIEGFTGHITNGHTGNGAAGPLDSLMEVIAPVLERFGGKGTDPESLKMAVAEALKEHEKTRPVTAAAPTPRAGGTPEPIPTALIDE